MEGKSEESVVREYRRLQIHLNPRNSVLSKTRRKCLQVREVQRTGGYPKLYEEKQI